MNGTANQTINNTNAQPSGWMPKPASAPIRRQLPAVPPMSYPKDDEGFQVPRYNRPRFVLGKKKDSNLKGGYEEADIFVFRVNRNMMDSSIKDYLESQNIDVMEYELRSHPNARMKSFRVKIKGSDYKRVMDGLLA